MVAICFRVVSASKLPSEYLTREKIGALAGDLVTLTIKQPWRYDVKLKSITIGCSAATNFVRVRAGLLKTPVNQLIGLKWMLSLQQVGGWIGLDVNWPRGFNLVIILRVQDAVSKLYYTVEYERYTPEEEKVPRAGWGE